MPDLDPEMQREIEALYRLAMDLRALVLGRVKPPGGDADDRPELRVVS